MESTLSMNFLSIKMKTEKELPELSIVKKKNYLKVTIKRLEKQLNVTDK
jgi:hypothetical protein